MRRVEQQHRIAFDADIADPKKQSARGLAVTNDAEFFAARIVLCGALSMAKQMSPLVATKSPHPPGG